MNAVSGIDRLIPIASSLVEVARWRAEHQASRIAYTWLADGETETARWTYAELDLRARAIAESLVRTAQAGDRAVLIYPAGLEFIAAFLGCMYAGITAVPIAPPRDEAGQSRSQALLADCEPSILLTLSAQAGRLAVLLPDQRANGVRLLSTDEIDPALAEGWHGPRISSRGAGAPLLLQYTSGSTSAPKGVMVSAQNLTHNEELIRVAFGVTEESVIVGWLPLYHDMGLIGTALQPLYSGAHAVLMPPVSFIQRPARWLECISRYRASISGGPNFAYDLCLRRISDEARARLDLSSWQVAFNGAEPVRAQTLREFAREFSDHGFQPRAWRPCYGLAEATLLVSVGRQPTTEVAIEPAQATVSCGPPAEGQEVLIVNPETLRPCNDSEVGEIWVRGQSVAAGYWQKGAENRSTFAARPAGRDRGAYLRTGDLGFLAAGELFVTGRLKDLIIQRGRNHYPQDIELTVEQCHPTLRPGGCAAFTYDESGIEKLAIACEAKIRKKSLPAELIERIRASVAQEHELETSAVLLLKRGALPKTTSGKVRRHACRELLESSSASVIAIWRREAEGQEAGRQETELYQPEAAPKSDRSSTDGLLSWLSSECARSLGVGVAEIDPQRPLVNLGLDSLQAIELAHSIERHWHVAVPPSRLFAGCALVELAAEVAAHSPTRAERPPEVSSNGQSIERPEDLKEFALSYNQQSLFFLHRLSPHSAAYNIFVTGMLTGPFDPEAFSRALASVVRRQASLRTIFVLRDGLPIQRVQDRSEPRLLQEDASGWSEAQLHERLQQEATLPFDLGVAPAWRVKLFRSSADRHVLALTVHHILADLWSLTVWLEELTDAYLAESSDSPPNLPALTTTYGDLVRRQSAWLASPEGEQARERWLARLGGDWAVLRLPATATQVSEPQSYGTRKILRLGRSCSDRVRRFSQSQGVTPYVTLLSVFQVLLSRYTAQRRFLIGSPTAGRDHAEFSRLIGYFVNPIVLRADLEGSPNFLQLLRRARQEVSDALADSAYPFSELVERLRPSRSLDQSPLFNVMFVMQSAPGGRREDLIGFALGASGSRLSLGLASLESLDFDPGAALYDLTLAAGETNEDLILSLQYRSNFFTAETAERMLGHFQTLLESALSDPERPIHEAPLLTPEELNRRLIDWNPSSSVNPSLQCVHRLFESKTSQTPSAIAISCEGKRLTYDELNRRSNQLAHYLRECGVGPDSPVALCLERSLDLVIAVLGVMKAGGAYVPLDPTYPIERLAFILEDAGARALVTHGAAASLTHTMPIRRVNLDEDSEEIARRPESNPANGAELDHLAYIIYTSGSTGRPKGCLVTHRCIARLFDATQAHFRFTDQDVWTLFHSYAFDFSVWELWGALLYGGRLVIVPYWVSRSPEELLSLLREERVTILNQTPTALRQLLSLANSDFPRSLRSVICGGEELEPQLVKAWRAHLSDSGPELVNMYGITEITVHATYGVMNAAEAARQPLHCSIGRQLGDMRIYILDEHLQLLPVGVTGELFVSGPGLVRGYHRRPGLTAERFIPNPYSAEAGARLYRSGDLGRHLPNGEIEYLGRRDHQVQLHGFRVEPGEIEAALSANPAVRQAVVVARNPKALRFPSGVGAEGDHRPLDDRSMRTSGYRRYLKHPAHPSESPRLELVAYLVCEPGITVKTEELRQFLLERLPAYMSPARFIFVEELPTTSSGKLNRAALPELESARPELESMYVAPQTRAERDLAAIWRRVLDLDRVGIDDNFFALGGDSIRAIQVIAAAEAAGARLTVQDLFRHQTVRQLAAQVSEDVSEEAPMPSTSPFSLLAIQDLERMPDGIIDAYPLARMQAGLIFHSDQYARSSVYRATFLYRLRGKLDLAHFRTAVAQTVERHAILRASFDLVHFSEPLQMVHARVPAPLEIVDLSAMPLQEQEQELERWFATEKARDFDLWRPPLLRFTVHDLARGIFTLGLTCHDAILDGWSTALLLTEVLTRYNALLEGSCMEAQPPTVNYRNFVALERQTLESAECRRFWEGKQAESASLTGSKWLARPGGAAPQLGVLDVPIGQELSARLKDFARTAGVPLKSVLLAAHMRVMQLLTGQTTVVTGLEANGRLEQADGEQAVGQHLNTIPFNQRLSGGTWLELAQASFAVERELLPFRRFPYAEMQKMRGGQPLYEATFNYTHFHVFRETERLRQIEILDGYGRELTHYLLKTEFNRDAFTDHLNLDVIYDASRISDEQATRVGGYYLRTLMAMVEDPASRYEWVELLSETERQEIIELWNETEAEHPQTCLHELIDAQAQRSPESEAVIYEGTRYTYRELNDRANQLAQYLRGLGVGPEVMVGVHMERSADLPVALLAVLKAGAAYVPLDPDYPRERLEFMIRDSGVELVLTQERLWRTAWKGVEGLRIDSQWPLITAQSPEAVTGNVGPDNAAYLIYTSGSTGQPKGAINTHRAICNRLLWMQGAYRLGADDRVLQKTPISFDVSVWEFFWPLISGAALIMSRPGGHRDCAYLVRTITRESITTIHFVPSLLRVFLDEDLVDECRSLKRVICSGEELTHDLQRRFFEKVGAELHNLYGPTEAAVDVTAWACSSEESALCDKKVPIGRPIHNVQIYILDRHLMPCPVGTAGELHIGGICLARGYQSRPALTAERFYPDPFSNRPGARLYKTGDLAELLPDGAIRFLGRLDAQVKIRGARVEPGEIEAALMTHPLIDRAAVIARPEADGHMQLAAYIVPSRRAPLSSVELQSFLETSLPKYLIPSVYINLDELPLTPSGKLDRSRLPDPGKQQTQARLASLLERIEQFSDEEVKTLLQQEA
jgi:amino acid adenylation domain-containing protein